MKKRYLVGIPLGVVALAGLVWLAGLAAARIAPATPVVPPQAELTGPAGIQPGDVVTATAEVTVPAGTEIGAPEAAGAGILPLTGDLRWRFGVWTRRNCRATVRFRVLKSGKLSALTLDLPLRLPGTNRTETRRIPLPPLTARLDAKLAPDAELLLADPVTRPEAAAPGRWRYLWLLAALPAAAAAVFLWRRRRRTKAETVWSRALAAVRQLRTALDGGTLTPERGFARLCDVVRDYLEARLGLPASRRTTPEFMRELRRDVPELPEDRREFLHRFLTAADLVKFARSRTDRKAFDAAADRAEELIRATGPREEKR